MSFSTKEIAKSFIHDNYDYKGLMDEVKASHQCGESCLPSQEPQQPKQDPVVTAAQKHFPVPPSENPTFPAPLSEVSITKSIANNAVSEFKDRVFSQIEPSEDPVNNLSDQVEKSEIK